MAEGKHAAPGAYPLVEDLKVQFATEDGVVRRPPAEVGVRGCQCGPARQPKTRTFPQTVAGDHEVDCGSPQQALILSGLLLQVNALVAIEDMIDSLWPDVPPKSATNNGATPPGAHPSAVRDASKRMSGPGPAAQAAEVRDRDRLHSWLRSLRLPILRACRDR